VVAEVAVTVIPKLAAAAALTVSVAAALCASAPLVPVTAGENVPVPPPLAVVTVIVLVPDPVTVAGLKLAVAPEGSPDACKLTTPPNPFTGVTVTVYVALPPAVIAVEDVAVIPTPKSAAGAAPMLASKVTGALPAVAVKPGKSMMEPPATKLTEALPLTV
jgi:hypothetical protein